MQRTGETKPNLDTWQRLCHCQLVAGAVLCFEEHGRSGAHQSSLVDDHYAVTHDLCFVQVMSAQHNGATYKTGMVTVVIFTQPIAMIS